MRPDFISSPEIHILIYDIQKAHINRLVRNLGFYNLNNVRTATSFNEAVESCKINSPDVIITDNREDEYLLAQPFLNSIRKFSEIPVVIWGEKLNPEMENKLLSFKNSYLLLSKDGVFNLVDIIQRIGMKARNPQLWG